MVGAQASCASTGFSTATHLPRQLEQRKIPELAFTSLCMIPRMGIRAGREATVKTTSDLDRTPTDQVSSAWQGAYTTPVHLLCILLPARTEIHSPLSGDQQLLEQLAPLAVIAAPPFVGHAPRRMAPLAPRSGASRVRVFK